MSSSNFHLNTYLNNYDLVQKYISKNIYNIPKLESIILDIPLDQLQIFINNILKTKSILVYINFYFIFYIFLSYCSYVNFLKKNKKDYSLKIILKNKLEIEQFIHQFFLHTNFNTSFKYFFNLSYSKQNLLNNYINKNTFSTYENIFNKFCFKEKSNTNFLFNLKIPFLCLFKMNIYIDSFFENLNSKEIFSYCNFKFKNVKSCNNLFKLLTNSKNFWFLNI